MSNSQRHKRGGAGKWVLTGIACLIVAVFIVGLCLQVFAQSENLKPSNWFKKDEETEQLPEDDEGKENVGDSAFVQGTEERGIRLTSTSVEREVSSGYQSSFHLEATVLPENADNKNVKWSLAWKNPEISWAQGKDVYEYMSVSSSDSEGEFAWNTYGAFHSVDVTPIKAYGEEIVVTVTSEDNEEAFASKTFGYIKRVSNVAIQIDNVDSTIVIGGDTTPPLTGHVGYTMTDGTLEPTVSINAVNFYLKPINLSDSNAVELNQKLGTGKPSLTADKFQVRFSNSYLVRTGLLTNITNNINTYITTLRNYVNMQTDVQCLVFTANVTVRSDKTENIYETTRTGEKAYQIDISSLSINVNSVAVNDSDTLFHF